MEYRKLISFGKSSFVVSLPKPWVDKHKLKKGDIIHFDENDNNLVLMPKQFEKKEEEKEIIINVDGKPLNRIRRELIPSYINNFKTIILIGKELKDKAKYIEPLVQNLIALEIMEQTSNKIVAKDFLNMNDISINNLIRKMDVITRSMVEDCLNMFNEDNYENINYRDKDVNRLSYLIFRAVNYGLENQTHMVNQFKMNSRELLNYHLLAFHIEIIADEARRVARHMREVKLNKNQQKIFIDLLRDSKQNYLDTMKSFYTNNSNLAHSIGERKKDIMKKCDDFHLRNCKITKIAELVTRFKRLVVTVHKTGRLVYEWP